MAEHPHDASDPSSADGPAVEQQADEDYPTPFVGERKYLPPRPRVRREATLGTFNDEQWPGGDAVPATPSPCPRPATECWWHMAVHFLPLEERTREGCLFCADGPADAARAEVRSGQGYLRRDRPPPRTADDIAALTIDRDDARAALYRAHDDMGKMREDCAALRAENIKLRGEWADNLRAILRDHWPVYVQCNHADGKDQVVCACSRVQLPWGRSVGEAVGYWVEHVIEQLGTRTKEAQPMARDDAAPRAIIANLTAERDELRAEVGATFKKLCDAATLAGVREQERDEARAEVGALTAERDALKVELATVTKGRDAAALMFEDSAVWAENAERDARSLRAAVRAWQGWVDHRGNVGPLAAKYRAVGLSQVEQDLVDAACAFDREMGEGIGDT